MFERSCNRMLSRVRFHGEMLTDFSCLVTFLLQYLQLCNSFKYCGTSEEDHPG